MSEKGFEVITVSADGSEVEGILMNGTKHIVIPFTRKITPIHDIICLWKLVKVIKDLKPDIVHTHTPKAGLLGMIASRFCKVPVKLHTVAGLPLMETSGITRSVLEVTEKITYACADQVYPNSQGLKDYLLRDLQVPEGKVKLIGKGSSNGIDTDYFQRSEELEKKSREVRDKHKIRQGDLVFSFVGRIVRDKGLIELATAFKTMREGFAGTDRRLVLLLVGHFEDDLDPLPANVMEFIMKDESVILAGFQEDVRPWIMASDIFVFPSYREGFPNVVMQASLLGVPCIVSDINGCNEIVKHGVNGLIIPPKNVVALVTAMKALASDEAKCGRFASAGRGFVADNFKREVIWEALRKEYVERLQRAKEYKRPSSYTRIVKPFLDRFTAFVILTVASPVVCAIILALAIANRGKVWFRQERPGKEGKLFTVIKFKTMTDECDANGNLLPDEKRLTAIGKFVRKTSIDELPQLFNVLLGHMSFVGPRPLLKEYLPLYNDEQGRRHLVKPGITGWAQVNGRNSLSWPQKFGYDCWYVDNVSFALDFKILILTVVKVLKAEGISHSSSLTMEKFRGNA